MLFKSLISIKTFSSSISTETVENKTLLNKFSTNDTVSIKSTTSFFTRPNFINF
ncbi:hypothetical protein RB653_002818 [Dictyostelium firmibasis]|uniref:Uncharacterized protein n=1 Tax=Dictyostelium firmibasis TaxID=79012 RepID=A0AAN7TYX5_9MYCE